MEVKQNESTHNRPEGERTIDAPSVLINMPEFIKKIKKEKAWDKNDRNAIVVFKSDKMRIILVAAHKKTMITTEKPENIFSVQLLEGRLRFHANDEKKDVREDEIFVLHANLPYKIEALKKSVFLLTVVE